MSKRRHFAALRFTRRVTRQHGVMFAEAFLDGTLHSEVPNEAFGATGVITWPIEPDDAPGPQRETLARARYLDIEDEILVRTFSPAVRDTIAAAFVASARLVIERERPRRRKDRKP